MSLENAKSILNEASRVIGLKDSDMKKLSDQYEATRVSSFTADAAVVDPVIESVLEGQPEIVASEVVPEQVNQNIPLSNDGNNLESITPDFVQNANPSVVEPVVSPVSEPVMPTIEPVSVPVMNNEVQMPTQMMDDVQGGQSMFNASNLDTPQTFFDRVEQNANGGFTPEQPVNTNYQSEDPAILLIDNVRKVIEDKNAMINALSDKVTLLENQLKVSEEARRVAEAQRDAAHATLSQARQAEVVNSQGPTLTYQQQPPYQQAA